MSAITTPSPELATTHKPAAAQQARVTRSQRRAAERGQEGPVLPFALDPKKPAHVRVFLRGLLDRERLDPLETRGMPRFAPKAPEGRAAR
ncbi:MAG: hypothetical protein U0835_00575 [Isosphaeraceae bacterium]